MRFKTIFLIFALAMLMLAGVAWAEDDDDQGENIDNPFTNICPDGFVVVIEAPSSTHLAIASAFDGGCELVYNQAVVETCILNADCDDDDDDDESPLRRIARAYEAKIPAVALACTLCGGATPEDVETTAANIVTELQFVNPKNAYKVIYSFELQDLSVAIVEIIVTKIVTTF